MNSELIIALVVLFVAIGLFVFAFVVMLRRTAAVMHRAVAIGGHGLNKRETMMRVLESLNAEPKEGEGGIIQFTYWGENYLLYYADQSRHGWVMLADLYWAKYELNDANLSLVQEAVNEANGVTAPLATLFCLCDKDDGGITLHTRMPMPVTGGVGHATCSSRRSMSWRRPSSASTSRSRARPPASPAMRGGVWSRASRATTGDDRASV